MNCLLAGSALLLISCTKPAPSSPPNPSAEPATEGSGITVGKIFGYNTLCHYAAFDARFFTIEVADQPEGPGTLWKDARAAAKARGAVLAINGGFFTKDGKPLGICIDHGNKTGTYNSSSLGIGAFISHQKGKMLLARRAEFSNFKNPQFMLQSGPFLVLASKLVRVKPSNPRPRCFIAWDGANRWLLGHTASISLANLAEWLAASPFPQFNLKYALNLDGGRSCQMYQSEAINEKEAQISALLNRKVRNFLIVKKRS